MSVTLVKNDCVRNKFINLVILKLANSSGVKPPKSQLMLTDE